MILLNIISLCTCSLNLFKLKKSNFDQLINSDF